MDYGSHTLLSYIAYDRSVNIIVSLFGIAIYNVRICDNTVEECNSNAIFHKITIDAKRESFCFSSLKNISVQFQQAFYEVDLPQGMKAMVQKNIHDTSLQYQLFYLTNYSMFQNSLQCLDGYNAEVLKVIKKNVEKVLQTAAITTRSLKRFVKEHKGFWADEVILNKNGTDKKSIFTFYLLYIIGRSEEKILELRDLENLIKQNISNELISLDDITHKQLLTKMLLDENYSYFIIKGAKQIESWPYE